MTLAQLKAQCDLILDTTITSSAFLVAANNARKNAELRHNFEYCRLKATLSIDGVTGGLLANAVIAGEAARYAVVSGTLTPAATGTYTQTGTAFGFPLYTRTTGTLYYLYYDGDDWIITASATSATNAWIYEGAASGSPTGSGLYPPFGTYLGTASVLGTDTTEFQSIREIVALLLTNANGTNIPIDFARADIPIERDRAESELSDDYSYYNRYPSDRAILARGGASTSVIQRGTTLYIYPLDTVSTSPLAVTIEGYGWLNDYNSADLLTAVAPDFLVEHGFAYLQWHIVCELNYVYQRFVPRQEGVLSAPETARDNAWRDLILWDTYMVSNNTTRSR